MLFRAKIVCPQCQGTNCRRSRQRPKEGLRKGEADRLYRCLDCSHRFLAAERAAFGKRAGVSIPVVVVIAALAAGLTYWLARPEAPSPQAAQGALVAYDQDIRKAAEGGDPVAQFRLGEALLQDSSRSPESSQQAYSWLQKAAENGNTDAMIVLGRLSRTGVGILQNFGQASKWIQTAAERGSSEGMLEMGRLYRDGIGVEKSLIMAYVWFNRASAARNLDAVRERESIARILTPDELKEAQHQSSKR